MRSPTAGQGTWSPTKPGNISGKSTEVSFGPGVRSAFDTHHCFRLNEGHTVYLERMIGRQMYGEQFRQFKAMGGWKDLQDSVRTHSDFCRWECGRFPL